MLAFVTALTGCSQSDAKKADNSDSNIVIETILARHSIRSYKDQPVEREKLEQIVKCGISAPSALNEQPWVLRVVTDSAFFNGSSRDYYAANPPENGVIPTVSIYRNAPVVIFIATPSENKGLIDCGMLGENIMIAAQSLGLGSVCLTRPIRYLNGAESLKPYIDKLNLPEGYELIFGIGLGYPDMTPNPTPRDESKVEFID